MTKSLLHQKPARYSLRAHHFLVANPRGVQIASHHLPQGYHLQVANQQRVQIVRLTLPRPLPRQKERGRKSLRLCIGGRVVHFLQLLLPLLHRLPPADSNVSKRQKNWPIPIEGGHSDDESTNIVHIHGVLHENSVINFCLYHGTIKNYLAKS